MEVEAVEHVAAPSGNHETHILFRLDNSIGVDELDVRGGIQPVVGFPSGVQQEFRHRLRRAVTPFHHPDASGASLVDQPDHVCHHCRVRPLRIFRRNVAHALRSAASHVHLDRHRLVAHHLREATQLVHHAAQSRIEFGAVVRAPGDGDRFRRGISAQQLPSANPRTRGNRHRAQQIAAARDALRHAGESAFLGEFHPQPSTLKVPPRGAGVLH